MPLQFIGYMLAAFLSATVLTIFVSMFRKVKDDGFKSWNLIAIFFVLSLFAPYGYSEYLTRQHGSPMEGAIVYALEDAEIYNKPEYFKILRYKESTARIVLVVKERSEWGDIERTVMTMNLEKDEDGWSARKYRFINSFQRQKDESVFPPYW